MRTLAALAVAAAVLALPAQAGNRLRPVAILMYLVLSATPAKAPYPQLYVAPSDFRAEVAWLAAHGYRAVTLQRVFDAWRGAATLPAKPVVLTFDDGYLSDVRTALPVLRARHWPGVLNLEVANLKPVWGIRPPGVRRLLAAGWEVDAHTLTHPDLTAVDAARLREEVTGSRTAIRKMFHVPVNFFCYPAGKFDGNTTQAVRRAGYLGATTELPGEATRGRMFELHRIRVEGSDGVSGLSSKLKRAGV
jgi:peptidoglycan/xylan/chitin deacetylase (PgdA/CDA1 family)